MVGEIVRFRWRSWLGLSVAIFLAYGLINVIAPILVPYFLHTRGPAALGDAGLIVGAQTDAALLGRSLEDIGRTDPRLGAFLVTFMDTMCAMMMHFAIMQLAVVWFALRRGMTWAFWTVAIADVMWIPYLVIIGSTYSGNGVALSAPDFAFFIVVYTALAVAFLAGWAGLKNRPPAAEGRTGR